MYSSSTSSTSQGNSLGPNGGANGGNPGGLFRYGSAPSSLLATAVDSILNPAATREFSALGSHHLHMGPTPTHHSPSSHLFFPSSEASSQHAPESSCKTSNDNGGLQRAYGLKPTASTMAGVGSGSLMNPPPPPPLVRHSSSPAGFLNQLAHAAACSSNDESGFSTARARGISRLNSQLSFTRQEPLSRISEENENIDNGLNAGNEGRKSTHSYNTGSYGGAGWDDGHATMFSMGSSKRSKNISSDMVGDPNNMEFQIQFGMPQPILEMSSMDKMLNIPEDSVPCKIRAKRGCATHPRSIAERERRTRISGKLKRLHDLVPNMDKQTSYSDMLDLAVQHIKGLQNQVQKLNQELENCTCGCRGPQNCSAEEKR